MKMTSSKDSKAYLIPYPVESFSKPILINPEQTYIGRDPKDGIKIADTKISRRHALITKSKGNYKIEDLKSINGTFLNDRRIRHAALKNRDKITIGSRQFLFLSQPNAGFDLLMDPSLAEMDTIAISEDEVDLSELWAQNAQDAARGFIQRAARHSPHTETADALASARLSLLYRLSEDLRKAKDAKTMFNQGINLVLKAIPHADCTLIVSKSESDDAFNIAAFNLRDGKDTHDGSIPVSRTLFEWVLSEKVTLVSEDASKDLRFQDSDSIRIHNLRSIVCAPMLGTENVIGLLYAESRSIIEPMSREDAAFISAVANEMALSLDNLQLHRKALRNERMAAIGLTVSNLAHNIKNLIALNQSAVQLMGMHVTALDNPKIEQNWKWIQQSFMGINRLSVSMLEYVKEDRYLPKPTDINRSILKCRKDFEQSLSHEGFKFEFVLSDKNPVFMMDEDQLHRAILNLVINAADAVRGKKNGRIRISTAINKNQNLVVGVIDNGCGMPPQTKDRVLELFYTTKGTQGTGLGLPMVQKFVERLKGRLEISSKEGVGSVFKMIFPRQ